MATISENTQTDFDNAESIVMDMLQTSRPGISLRRGTVLRELLVRPMAELYAADTRRVEESMECRSLAIMQETGKGTTEEINAILANFSTSLYAGRNASGILFVQVESDSVYTIPSDTVFTSPDGLAFNIARTYIATSADVSGDEYLKLKKTDDGIFYFLLPVEADSIGSEYEVEAGVRFSISEEFPGLVSATSYSRFVGGLDAQTLSGALDELESAVSFRGMAGKTATKAMLLDKNAGNFSGIILDCSVVGFGDPEQIRDKSNVFGIATGGKVDLLVRSFSTPPVATFTKTASWDGTAGAWRIDFLHDEVPGYYAVKSVKDPDAVPSNATAGVNSLLSADSYPVSETFSVRENVAPLHTFPAPAEGVSTAFTAYRDVHLLVDAGNEEDEQSREFLVTLYVSPAVAAIQDYVDRDDVRSIRDDVLVRAAPVCLVNVSASVVPVPGHADPDTFMMRQAVAAYINSRSFVSVLSASEIIAVLNQFDISRVDMAFGEKNGFKMQGRVRSATGRVTFFPGPDINISAKANPKALLSKNTVCFATTVDDIDIKVIGR